MSIEELYEFADDWYKFSCKPAVQKYGKAHVFDENKSVKWNKEEVERRNILHDEEVKQLQKEKNILFNKLVYSVKLYIIEETKVKKATADKIYNYLYNEYHSYGMHEVLNHLDELLELFK